MGRLQRWGGGAQLLRGLLGFAFPFALVLIPAELRFTAPLIGGGVFAYLAARWLVLAEPTTLMDMGSAAAGHLGEAVFLSLALTMAVVLLGSSGLINVGVGAGVILVIIYLLLHGMLLPLLASRRIKRAPTGAGRPNLRRFIRAAAFVAGETVSFMVIAMALHEHDVARQGPWSVWSVLPITEVVLLLVGYLPIVWLEMAATDTRTNRREEIHGATEAVLIQVAAVVVCVFTGHAPWL